MEYGFLRCLSGFDSNHFPVPAHNPIKKSLRITHQSQAVLSRSSFSLDLDDSVGLWADIPSAEKCVRAAPGFESYSH